MGGRENLSWERLCSQSRINPPSRNLNINSSGKRGNMSQISIIKIKLHCFIYSPTDVLVMFTSTSVAASVITLTSVDAIVCLL